MITGSPRPLQPSWASNGWLPGPLAEVAIAVMNGIRGAAASRSSSSTTPAAGRSTSTFAAPSRISSRGCRRPRLIGQRRRDNRATEPRGRGRPKLGVVAREVTLLPRHWEWLAAQPGGASVALRKLVDEARRTQRRPRSPARRPGRGLSFHVGHGRQSAGFRGSLARVVRRRPAALCRPDRRLARRHPRSHRETRLCVQATAAGG